MKNNLFKILTICCISILLGCENSHLNYPLIITGVCMNDNTNHPKKYKITIKGIHDIDTDIFTDIKYNVGDTLK